MTHDECPNCGAGASLVPVWEDPFAQMLALKPDYLGCTACNTMERLKPEVADGE